MTKYTPCEFVRKPRTLNELDRFKATEFRTILLYTGVVCFHKYIDKNMYKQFMLLSCAIRLMSSKETINNVDIAHELLLKFIQHFEQMYGSRYMVYNVHCLSHLSCDVTNYGPLQNFSAFPFENHLGMIKKLLRQPNAPLQQVVNRLQEMENLEEFEVHGGFSYPLLKKQHYNCLLYTSPSPRDKRQSRMPSSA